MSDEKTEHPMTCGHMSTGDICPYECPDSRPVRMVVIDVADSEDKPETTETDTGNNA